MSPTSTLEPAQATERKTKLAPQWSVILHNDPVTTMVFVVDLLRTLFHKSQADAVRLMLEVHNAGAAVVCVTTLERGELYCEQVKSLARARRFPLVATIEPAG